MMSRMIELLSFDPKEPLVFNSGLFLLVFILFLIFHQALATKKKARLIYITIFSMYFYYKSTGFYAGLLLLTSYVDFALAQFIYDSDNDKRRKMLLIASIVTNLVLLGYFKYTNMLIGTWNAFAGGTLSPLDIFLPAGISFYTFQSLSYTIDVYRKELAPLKSYLDFCFCVSFFPHLVAGPIIRASYIIPQLANDYAVTREEMGRAVYLIVAGLFKKAVIADYLSLNFIDRVFQEPLRFSGMENLCALYSYALQIYCDFSGYSDMAIGIALLLGFKIPVNFNSPYQSVSVTEFWRRWHISLSSWLRDYLYIPLGGGLAGKWKQYRNLMLTMLLGGLWHGASWKFVFWGGVHGLVLAVEKALGIPTRVENSAFSRLAGRLVTFHVVCFCWIFFRAESFAKGWEMTSQIATDFYPGILPELVVGYPPIFMLLSIGFVIHVLPRVVKERAEYLLCQNSVLTQAAVLAGVIFVVVQVKSSNILPFIYFQF